MGNTYVKCSLVKFNHIVALTTIIQIVLCSPKIIKFNHIVYW